MFVVALATVSVIAASCGITKKVAPVNAKVTTISSTSVRKEVTNVQGLITYRPDTLRMRITEGSQQKVIGILLDAKNGYLFMTDNQDLYTDLCEWIPAERESQHVIGGQGLTIVGPTIDPLTTFSADQFAQLGEELKKRRYELNNFQIAWLSNYAKVKSIDSEPTRQETGSQQKVTTPSKVIATNPAKQVVKPKVGSWRNQN